MNQIWEWFGKNAAHLRGIAALVVIIGGLVAAVHFIGKLFQPELTVVVRADESTIPPDVRSWVKDVSTALDVLPPTSTNQQDAYARVRQLQITNMTQLVGLSSLDSIGRLRLDIVNETDHVVPGVRIRLSTFNLWNASLGASFLTDQELTSWQQGLPKYGQGDVVLPELPAIPPRSAVAVFAYGQGASYAPRNVSLTVPGNRYKIINIVSVQDRWPVSWALRPFLISYLAFICLLLSIPIGWFWIQNRVWSKAENKTWSRAKRVIPYDLACQEAKAGRKDSALALLSTAVSAGYHNWEHMREDTDLATLHGSPEFEKLIAGGEKTIQKPEPRPPTIS